MEQSRTISRIRRAVAVAVAGATLGVTGAAALAATDGGAGNCRPTESDLMRAAISARRLRADRPELFTAEPKPASYEDLRLAAEWARRLELLAPEPGC